MALFTYLKIILLQYFQFSVLATISCIQIDPYVSPSFDILLFQFSFNPLYRVCYMTKTHGSLHKVSLFMYIDLVRCYYFIGLKDCLADLWYSFLLLLLT